MLKKRVDILCNHLFMPVSIHVILLHYTHKKIDIDIYMEVIARTRNQTCNNYVIYHEQINICSIPRHFVVREHRGKAHYKALPSDPILSSETANRRICLVQETVSISRTDED